MRTAATSNNNRNYELSNKHEKVRLSSFRKTYSASLLGSGEDIRTRQRWAAMLLDYLCAKFNIEPVSLCVTSKPRPCKGNGQLYGCYAVMASHIIIYNTTAKTHKPISIKTFYDTLLHEFMHHYDYKELSLTDSPHTAGFYKRISDLKKKLGGD